MHPGATAGGMGTVVSAGDDHVRLEASEFVVQLAEGGGAHGKGGTQVAYGPDERVPVQVAEVLEGNQSTLMEGVGWVSVAQRMSVTRRHLRRVMCNELDQQVRQVAQRSAEGVVDLLCAGVGRDLGR